MKPNKQRLQLWLEGKVAAYNNGSTQAIEMIKELCKYSKTKSTPSGSAKFYAHDKLRWYPFDTIDRMQHHPVSWFFEPDESMPNKYQGLFNLMSLEHNLILTITEMDEIIRKVTKINE